MVKPARSVTASPSFGFSATTRKLWKAFCRKRPVIIKNTVLPYIMQLLAISPVAPRSSASGFIKIIPMAERITPLTIQRYMSIEKYSLAFSSFFSPRVLDTMALPPVPTIKPVEPSIIITGIIRFTAANASLPTQFDTNTPSTMPYIDVNIIMAIVGSVKRMSLLYESGLII